MASEIEEKIISLRFNQDYSCFSCALNTGVRLYNVDPLCEQAYLGIDTVGSAVKAEMIYRANMIAIVGGGPKARKPDNCLMIYDAQANEFNTTTKFSAKIRAVRMKNDKIAVSTARKLYVFDFPSMKMLIMMDLRDNLRGILEMTPLEEAEREIVVFPGCKMGSVQIIDITNIEQAQSKSPLIIECHNNELCCIALNQEGTKLATASEQGTIIRIWNTITKEKLIELRRGCEAAQIYSLAFSLTSDYLCCSSDKGTVHIFAIGNIKLNRSMLFGAILGKFGGPLKSFATFQLPPECPCVCAFNSNDSVVAIGMDGSFNKYLFNLEGRCTRDVYDIFLDLVGHHFRG